MRITIIGVGALGSHLVQALRNEDAALKVIDFDRVEMKNVASQFHFKGTVGHKKTEAIKRSMNFAYGRKIEAVGSKLTSDNVTQLLSNTDLLVDCLDNGDSRRLVQDFAQRNGVPCVHGALAADGGFGRVVWSSGFVIDNEASGAATCEDGAFLPFIQLVAARIAYVVQRFLQTGEKLNFNVFPGGVTRF